MEKKERWYIVAWILYFMTLIGLMLTVAVIKPNLYRHPEWCLYYGGWMLFVWLFPFWLIGKMSEEFNDNNSIK